MQKYIKRNQKLFVRTICYVYIHFLRVLNFYVHVTRTFTNAQVIFWGQSYLQSAFAFYTFVFFCVTNYLHQKQLLSINLIDT